MTEESIAINVLSEDESLGEEIEREMSRFEGSSAENRKLTLLSANSGDVWMTVISISASVPSGLFVAWLYDKIKGRAYTIEIERTEIEMSLGEITRVVHEKINIKK